jgi:hypothetical protein
MCLANTILDLLHRPVFYLKHTTFRRLGCFRLQLEPTQMDPIERFTLSLDTSNRDRD